ncbi:hypothetical protein DV735_g225, partial [Chaetothyriales sp. CBS 134920]
MAFSTTAKVRSDVPKELPGDEPDDVLFNSVYGVRTIELNRPKKLNSLNGSMVRKILPRLREWEKSQLANVILITGAGTKAFCAGGDVAELARQNATKEGQKKSTDYFELEYQLDHLIATYSKPYVAIMDGITMGGGVGLSVHAPFRIATEKTVFAMPETTIGFFPDVGGSFFLPRLDGEVGTYLALTSERLHGVQALYAGIATHYIDSSVLAPLTTRLSELVFHDYSTLDERLTLVNSTIAEFTSSLPSPDSYEAGKNGNLSGSLREAIDGSFKYNKIEEIVSAVEKEASSSDERIAAWAKSTLKTFGIRSPTSLKVTLEQLRLGKRWNISETFVREHQIAAHFMAHPDFTEGVTARLINKPATAPKWQPGSLAAVSVEEVNRFFEKKAGVEEMPLLEPIDSQSSLHGYKDYPWARFALPRESDINQVVKEVGDKGKTAVVKEILSRWNHKLGVKEKTEDVLARKTRELGSGIKWVESDSKLDLPQYGSENRFNTMSLSHDDLFGHAAFDESDGDEGYDSEAAEISKASRAAESQRARKRRRLSGSDSEGDDSEPEEEVKKAGEQISHQPNTLRGAVDKTAQEEGKQEAERRVSGTGKGKGDKKKKKARRPGVVYLSSIPPHLRPSALRNLLEQRGFGPITRLFLTPITKDAAKKGTSTSKARRSYAEGWVEFASHKTAKLCAQTLNATPIGGKKGSYYRDDLWNMKYLRGMGWEELMDGVRGEKREEEARRDEERRQIQREAKIFLEGVEEGKRVEGMREKRKQKGQATRDDGRQRTFRQVEAHVGTGTRTAESETGVDDEARQVLSKIF